MSSAKRRTHEKYLSDEDSATQVVCFPRPHQGLVWGQFGDWGEGGQGAAVWGLGGLGENGGTGGSLGIERGDRGQNAGWVGGRGLRGETTLRRECSGLSGLSVAKGAMPCAMCGNRSSNTASSAVFVRTQHPAPDRPAEGLKPARRRQLSHIVQELCRGGRPGLAVLTSLLVYVDVKNY